MVLTMACVCCECANAAPAAWNTSWRICWNQVNIYEYCCCGLFPNGIRLLRCPCRVVKAGRLRLAMMRGLSKWQGDVAEVYLWECEERMGFTQDILTWPFNGDIAISGRGPRIRRLFILDCRRKLCRWMWTQVNTSIVLHCQAKLTQGEKSAAHVACKYYFTSLFLFLFYDVKLWKKSQLKPIYTRFLQ